MASQIAKWFKEITYRFECQANCLRRCHRFGAVAMDADAVDLTRQMKAVGCHDGVGVEHTQHMFYACLAVVNHRPLAGPRCELPII